MSNNKCTDFDVTELLPQHPPFIMVDQLIYCDPLKSVTTLTVCRDTPFCKAGVMEEAGLIENIAQTCAAKTGYSDRTEPGRDGVVKIGFIGMIKRMDIYRNPLAGEQLTTTTEILEEVFDATLVGSRVEIGEEVIATCEMKTYLTGMVPADK